jgi:DNA-directed RNA polymerase specialized sigma24 family protein
MTYGAIVVEFFDRWTPWIDSAVARRSPAGAAGEEFRERLRAAFVRKLTEGALTRLENPKAWGKYLSKTMNNLAVDLVRSRPLERDPLANTVAASDLASGSRSTEEPNQDGFIYQQIRTEVIVLSSGDYQPLETFDLYFVDGCTIDQIAARRGIGARTAERATKRACEFMATAADKFGWSRFADECRRRSQSLKGTAR